MVYGDNFWDDSSFYYCSGISDSLNPHQTNSTLNLMLLGLPAYSSISGLLAYLVYGERPEVAWVLLYLVWAAFGFCFLMSIL